MKPCLRQVFALVLFALFAAIFAAPRIACASVPNIVDAKGTRYASFNAALANVPNGGSTTLTVTNDVSAPTPVDLTVDRNINVTLVPDKSSGVLPTLGNINISAGSLTLKRAGTLFVVTGLTKVSGGSLTTDGTGFYNNIQATGNAKLSLTDTAIQDASYYNKRSGMLATLDLTGKVTCNLYGCNIHGNVYVGSGCTIPHLNRGGITMEHAYTTRGKYGLYVDKGGKVGAISNCTIYGADGSMRFMSRNTTPIEGCTLISGKGKYITPGSADESDWNGARVEKSLEKTLHGRWDYSPDKSYTAKLLQGKEDKLLSKLAEETSEVIMACKDDDHDHIRYEAADLIYHLLVVLERYGITPEELAGELDARMR